MKFRQLLLGHLLMLFLGGSIYLVFRSMDLRMFRWCETVGVLKWIDKIRAIVMPVKEIIPEWCVFALPDGLWMFSFMSLILMVWNNIVNRKNIIYIASVPIIALFSELLQYLGIVNGTFDKVDFLMYSLGMLLPFIIYKKSIKINLN